MVQQINVRIRVEPFKKVRLIKATYSSKRGTIFTEKSIVDGYVEFESLIEAGLYHLLVHDPNCIDIESQPVAIPRDDTGDPDFYYPDTWSKFNDGRQYLFDVKSKDFLNALKGNTENRTKWERRHQRIDHYCKIHALNYQVLTEDDIFGVRLQNIQFFGKNQRCPDLLVMIEPIIKQIFSTAGALSRIEFANRIARDLGISVDQIIPVIDHLIFHDYFALDFEELVTDDTILQIKNPAYSSIVPLHEYFARMARQRSIQEQQEVNLFNDYPADPNVNDASRREFLALSTKEQKTVLDRIALIDVFKKAGTSTDEIKRYAKGHHVALATLYRWKKSFGMRGWIGLIPNSSRSGRKGGFDIVLETIVQKVIEEKYLNANEPSVKGVYRFLCAECKKHGLNPPHYNTFRNRVDSVADKVKTEKRRGRKVLRDVFRPLYGQDYHVNYPLGVVEIDHTVLDVMLVDRFERKLVGRPKVTVAIDVDTRMVFGYHVSFDAPDLLAVGMCMLNGILPKDEITKKFGTRNIWPIRGLPKSILLDNAKEFRSGGFFNFCKLYAIEMVFCPVKKPDTKPHVERFIKTLNEAIRDDLINGYVIPLAEKRRTGHDPEKHAELTIDEFETWLVHWIVDEYHQRVHDGIKEKEGVDISPQRWYEQRLEETGGCIVGAPTMPVNVNQLKFDVLPFEKRLLQRGGIKMWGLEYNASIIAEIRTQSSNSKVEHVVKYDPRDIREVYLWVEQKGRYFNIPLKNVYMEQLRINPRDPSDNPLSLQEYEHIKEAKGKKYGMPQHELAEARALRQEILDVARTKVKHAKKSRRIVEKQQINKTNATSMKIRENNEPAEELSEEEEFLPAIAMQENTDADNGFKPEIMPARYYDDDFEGDMHE